MLMLQENNGKIETFHKQGEIDCVSFVCGDDYSDVEILTRPEVFLFNTWCTTHSHCLTCKYLKLEKYILPENQHDDFLDTKLFAIIPQFE